MNNELAIRICGLSKTYDTPNVGSGFLPGLIDFFSAPARLWSAHTKTKHQALSEVSVDIPAGSAVALVGPNGAGKSTLLRILSRISEPTSGYADVYGRVGSLLDVGVGFHPELTGRENIFLGGAVLGLSRRNVERRLEQIVDFSGVEKQLNIPIKYYSTGQFLRLGFAVAAFLENDILLLDEVLSVGDIDFQRRCLDKVRELVREGRTAIVVNHHFTMTSSLCDSAIYLRNGRLKGWGDFQTVLVSYIRDFSEHVGSISDGDEVRPYPSIEAASSPSCEGAPVISGQRLTFQLRVNGGNCSSEITVGLSILNAKNHAVASAIGVSNVSIEPRERALLSLSINDCSLVPGVYSVRLSLLNASSGRPADFFDSVSLSPAFQVVSSADMPLPLTGEWEGALMKLELAKENAAPPS